MTPALETRAFATLSALLEKHSGQVLVANRHWRIEMALKPIMRNHSIPDVGVLVSILSSEQNSALAIECVEAMINNETCFFRDQANFALITGPMLDSIRERRLNKRVIRIWSAACSTGQEAYSIALSIAENAEKWRGWTIQIVGTDVSKTALAQARQGRYSQFEIQRGLPVTMMLKYFSQNKDDWSVKENLQKMVVFSEHNMFQPARHLGAFDLVLCRNMLMYLGDDGRKTVFGHLASAVAPDGYLVLGAAETVIGQTDRFIASRDFRGFYEPQAAKIVGDSIIPRAFG